MPYQGKDNFVWIILEYSSNPKVITKVKLHLIKKCLEDLWYEA